MSQMPWRRLRSARSPDADDAPETSTPPARASADAPEPIGPQRLTVAWIVALLAIAVVSIGSTLAVDRSLRTQSEAAALSAVVHEQDDRLDQLAAMVRGGTVADVPRLPEELSDGIAALVAGSGAIEDSMSPATDPELVTMSRAALDDLVAAVDRARGTITLTGAVRPAVDEVAARAADYSSVLQGISADAVTIAAEQADETRALGRSTLYATLALLVLEAFLLFVPVTRGIRRTLDSRGRQLDRERRWSQWQLEVMARHDSLTGVANRAEFGERLQRAVDAADRSGKRAAVMFLDLDRFKTINDRLGHEAGDVMLVQVSQRLAEAARRTDTVARFGGDEFTLLLENLDHPSGAATVARKILELLVHPFEIDGHLLPMTASIGIALYPDDASHPDELLRAADAAMYHAKSAGRANFQFSTLELRDASVARLQMIEDVRLAMDEDRLALVYQPEVDLRTGRTVAVEALTRWHREDDEVLAAGRFMEVIENTDLIVPLCIWTLREACRQAIAWQAEGVGPLRVAVNISSRQFHEPAFATRVATVLHESGLEPGLLELEVTEQTLTEDDAVAASTLRILDALGVRVVIDDFGTGSVTLTTLPDYPIDGVKIDGRYLTQASDSGYSVPGAIANLARSLGLVVVAEGVETAGQLEIARQAGCDLVQGFLVARPLAPTAIPHLFRSAAWRPPAPEDAGATRLESDAEGEPGPTEPWLSS